MCMCMSYLNDFLRQSGVEPAELFPVGDEQLKHITGCLSHCFVLKLDKQTRGQDKNQSMIQRILLFDVYKHYQHN